MPALKESIKNELISSLKTNMAFLEKHLPKNQSTNVCQNNYNLIQMIENKLKDTTSNSLNVSNDIQEFINLISESKLFKWINIENVSDNHYIVKVEQCDLVHNCMHPRLNPEKKICPFALVASSFLQYNNPTAKIFIEPSKFTPQDSETTINLMN